MDIDSALAKLPEISAAIDEATGWTDEKVDRVVAVCDRLAELLDAVESNPMTKMMLKKAEKAEAKAERKAG